MLRSVLLFLLLILIWMTACDLVDEAIVTVSGNVSDDGEPLSGALVILVESPDSSDGLNLANGSITGSSGNYTILDVDPGDYYVMAVEDANENLKFDVMYDRLGFFGIDPAGNDLTPDAIVVTDDDLENINIKYLYSLDTANLREKAQRPQLPIDHHVGL